MYPFPPPAPSRPTARTAPWWMVFVAGMLGAALAVGGVALVSGDRGSPAPTGALPVVATAPSTSLSPPLPTQTTTPISVPPRTTTPTREAPVATPERPLDPAAVGRAVIDSVVTVQVGSEGSGGFAVSGSGSGVIIDTNGHIVTNEHVVDAGNDARVVLADGRIYGASLIGIDRLTDLAVIRIEADGLTPILLGAADMLHVGDPAIAVGNPLGLEGGPSLTVGVVSAFGRQVRTTATTTLYGMLQTDAPITQGSSGGALVDGGGALIGITTAVGVSDVGIEGIGFATPVEIVGRVIEEILAEGSVAHAYLGITGATGFDDTSDGGTRSTGVTVLDVQTGSAAARAGIAQGDLISTIGETQVDTMDGLISLLRRMRVGDHVNMSVLRDGLMVTVPVVLGAQSA